MAPSIAAQKLALYVVGLGGQVGDEDVAIQAANGRLKRIPDDSDCSVVRAFFRYGMHPLQVYMENGLGRNKFLSMPDGKRAEVLYDVLKIVTTRTKIVQKYSAVVDSDEEWLDFEEHAKRVVRDGHVPVKPGYEKQATEVASTAVLIWWLSKPVAVSATAIPALAFGYTKLYADSGRQRIAGCAYIAMTLVLMYLILKHGPRNFTVYTPQSWQTPVEPEDTQSEGSDVESDASRASSIVTAAEAVAVEDMREANRLLMLRVQALEGVNATAPTGSPALPPAHANPAIAVEAMSPSILPSAMRSLINYANETQQTGALSETARLMQAHRGGPGAAAMPAALTPTPLGGDQRPISGSGWHPFMNASTTQAQAHQLYEALRVLEGRRAYDGAWAADFWSEVAAISARQALSPDLERVLVAHGYYGPGTAVVPRDTLRTELRSFAETGGPTHGAGIAPSERPRQAAAAETRWEHKLDPSVKRAAPEIYRNMRSQGVSNCREWVDRNFRGDKTGAAWVDLWNLATEVDFVIGPLTSDEMIFGTLSNSDGLEIKMRRLASKLYEDRTGDTTGAMKMLAVAPPGMQVDLAPSWLVDEVTTHSRNEHQRAERVAASKRGGKGSVGTGDGDGRGRGRGRGRKGGDETGGEGRGGRRGGRGRGRG